LIKFKISKIKQLFYNFEYIKDMKNKTINIFVGLFLVLLSSQIFAKEPGDKIDDFTIVNFDNKTYTLSEVKDSKAIVIIFWSAECPFVQGFNDRINDIVKPYIEKGVTFWGINSNQTETVNQVMEHYKNNNYIFPMLKDEGSKVADIFEATRTPEVFILDNGRTILYHGRLEDNSRKEKVTTHDMTDALDEILAGKEVTSKTTKSFGCTIKRNEKN